PKCAGGTFLRQTGSKSNTLMASFGRSINPVLPGGAQIIGSGSFEGASMPQAASEGDAKSGLPARYCRKRRRLVARMIVGVIEGTLPLADVILYGMHDRRAGDRPEGAPAEEGADTQPCINRRAALLARKVEKIPGK